MQKRRCKVSDVLNVGELAKAQMESLNLKKAQIHLLTQKLNVLEQERQFLAQGQQKEDADEAIQTIMTEGAAIAAEEQERIFRNRTDNPVGVNQDQLMMMLSDPEFQVKISKLQEQEAELKYLEEQYFYGLYFM